MAKSAQAEAAYTLVRKLQKRFVDKLNNLSRELGEHKNFEEVTWLRDKGLHGGGSRFEARDEKLFNTASVNVSQVHYDEMPDKNLKSATAISTIIHPKNPHVPSIHIHISLTVLRDNTSYWRIMADLNPSIFNQEDKTTFDRTLQKLDPDTYEEATLQGDKYFNIPALERHRGVSHYYLENYNTHNSQKDYDFALNFGVGVIDSYIDIIDNALRTRRTYSQEEMQKQLASHTLYLFQVLTLDRGTTSGLLIHDQNDLGIMGSLPSYIDKELLNSWKEKVSQPQNELVKEIAHVINASGVINADTKARLADVVRKHYNRYPDALKMQASGNTIPNTLNNHAKP